MAFIPLWRKWRTCAAVNREFLVRIQVGELVGTYEPSRRVERLSSGERRVSTYSSVAQWQSRKLLTLRFLVRVQAGERMESPISVMGERRLPGALP